MPKRIREILVPCPGLWFTCSMSCAVVVSSQTSNEHDVVGLQRCAWSASTKGILSLVESFNWLISPTSMAKQFIHFAFVNFAHIMDQRKEWKRLPEQPVFILPTNLMIFGTIDQIITNIEFLNLDFVFGDHFGMVLSSKGNTLYSKFFFPLVA